MRELRYDEDLYMNKIVSIFMFFLAISATIFLVHMIRCVSGFRKNNLISVYGFLDQTEVKRHVFRGHPLSGEWHEHWTDYTYVYRVNDKRYETKGGISGLPNDLPQRINILVQKSAPQYAFIPHFEKAPSPWSLSLLFVGCFLSYACGIALWIW